jgi:CBS domain containing-hemolysin-like protein
MELIITLLAIIILLLLQGFFSGSEIALVHSDKLKLQHLANKGKRGAQLVLKLFTKPETILGTTLIGTNIAVVTSTTLGTILMIDLFGEYGDIIAFLVFTPLLLIFGEVVPKSVYQQKANTLAPIVIYPLKFFSFILFPVVFIFSKTARLVAKLLGAPATRPDLFKTREQLRSVIDMSDLSSEVDIFDRERIRKAVRLSDMTAGQLMVPVTELVALEHRDSMHDAVGLIQQFGHLRLPVFSKQNYEIKGVAVFSLWDMMDRNIEQRNIEEFIVAPLFVAPNQPIIELFTLLEEREDHIAIVVDEFGSAEGMIALEDIYEEVVGDAAVISSSFGGRIPRQYHHVEILGNDRFLLDARLPLSEAREVLNIRFPTTSAQTVGGLITSTLMHIPRQGEFIVSAGYRFTASEVTTNRVIKVLVEPMAS